jgi:hypothetical protein
LVETGVGAVVDSDSAAANRDGSSTGSASDLVGLGADAGVRADSSRATSLVSAASAILASPGDWRSAINAAVAMMPTDPNTMVRGSIGHSRRTPRLGAEALDFALAAGFDAAFTVRLLAGFDPDRRFNVFTGTPIPSCVLP